MMTEPSAQQPSGPIDPDLLQRVRVVLVAPSHPGNIGAAARALKTMGLSRLVLVRPRMAEALTHDDAIAFATGATDLLDHATVHDDLVTALAGCNWAVAMTARHRDIMPITLTPRAVAQQALRHTAQAGNEVALVFGNERYGLDNADVLTCQACCAIPTSAFYSSLNLAQAIQILAYECRLAALETTPAIAARHDGGPLAGVVELEQMYAHLQEALIATEFLNPAYPKKLMSRLRRLFGRSALEIDEVNILRGICSNILATRTFAPPGSRTVPWRDAEQNPKPDRDPDPGTRPDPTTPDPRP